MAEPRLRRYWDACCFTALIAGEAGRAETCQRLLDDAAHGVYLACTAAHTLVEITRQSNVGLQVEKRTQIDQFFENDYILIIDVDRFLAEQARKLAWDLKLRPADALHVAAAMRAGAGVLYTYDEGILGIDGKVPLLRIMKPD